MEIFRFNKQNCNLIAMRDEPIYHRNRAWLLLNGKSAESSFTSGPGKAKKLACFTVVWFVL
jgi:hypothetical protein